MRLKLLLAFVLASVSAQAVTVALAFTLTRAQANLEKGTAAFVYHYRLDAAYKDSGGLKVYTAPFTVPGIRQLLFYDAQLRYQYVRVLSPTDVSRALTTECGKLKGCTSITVEQLKTELSTGRAS